jgi:predicted phosphohydrolase
MDIFAGWENHISRLVKNWNETVSDTDTVVIPGDVSWAPRLNDAGADLRFINDTLKGNKIILKGNHDYWWNTASKMNNFLSANGFSKIKIINNCAALCENIVVCGTRGWINENDVPCDVKILEREAARLELSVKDAVKILASTQAKEIIAFIHYPPVFANEENYRIIEILRKYGIKRCFYGHVHGKAKYKAFVGIRDNIEYSMVSADTIGFTPVLVQT